jgi:hypothetical protein
LNEYTSRIRSRRQFSPQKIGSTKYFEGQSPATAYRKRNNSSLLDAEESPSPLKALDLSKIQTEELRDQAAQFQDPSNINGGVLTTHENEHSPLTYGAQQHPYHPYMSQTNLSQAGHPAHQDWRSSKATLLASRRVMRPEDSSSNIDTNRESFRNIIAPKFTGIGFRQEIKL